MDYHQMSILQHYFNFQLGLRVHVICYVSFTLLNAFPKVGSMCLNVLKSCKTMTHIFSMSDQTLLDEMCCINTLEA